MKQEKPSRAERAAEARELRNQGLFNREIGAIMGISATYASALLCDPDGSGEQQRKDSYRRPCPICGTKMTGCNGPANAPDMCKKCAAEHQHRERYWQRDTIIAALLNFQEVVGRAPSVPDVVGRQAAKSAQDRLSEVRLSEIFRIPDNLRLPPPSIVAREFGSWKEGLQAAGIESRPTGTPGHRIKRGSEMRGTRQFVVLSKNGSDWVHRETVDAHTQAGAIEKVADGEGTYIAVPSQFWLERTVAPRTVFSVVETP